MHFNFDVFSYPELKSISMNPIIYNANLRSNPHNVKMSRTQKGGLLQNLRKATSLLFWDDAVIEVLLTGGAGVNQIVILRKSLRGELQEGKRKKLS